nr:S-layer homology domain-containing protein [Feifania hominis]
MLTRVFKKVSIPGWTLATDDQFSLNYTKPAPFADDAQISDWAKDSVYFMAANGIMGGMDNNMFAPKNVTTKQQAEGYANATREQALLIAVRMVLNLGN